MVRYIILEDNIIDEDGNILFYGGHRYMLEDSMVVNEAGYGVYVEDIWVSYQVNVEQAVLH